MKRKSIAEMCEERYSRPEVAQAVMDDAARLGTTAAIESGERTLPHEQDAERWYATIKQPELPPAQKKRKR